MCTDKDYIREDDLNSQLVAAACYEIGEEILITSFSADRASVQSLLFGIPAD